MTEERYLELTLNMNASLTNDEIQNGWHFCPNWDYMLVGATTPEWECCTCSISKERRK